MEPIVKYKCPVCYKEYETPEEAKNCFVPLRDRFKNGDIVKGGYHNIYVVEDAEERNYSAATVREIKEYIVAQDIRRVHQGERSVMVGGFWCDAEKYPLEDAKKLVSDLRRRLKNAEKFLEMVKKMYEEDTANAETETTQTT